MVGALFDKATTVSKHYTDSLSSCPNGVMAAPSNGEAGAPPAVANFAIASMANTGAIEQQIDPWSVSAAIDEQGNTLSFDYEAISRYAI